MIDVHCHILPGIDDGAKSAAMSAEMLRLQRESGVERMFLTPHFYPEDMERASFLYNRAAAWAELSATLSDDALTGLRLGAEVRYCPQLLELDLHNLTLGESDYLLLELPGSRYPAYLVQILENLLSRGVLPILAHVERCGYFREDPALLKRLVDLGALAQVSADALFDRRDRNFSVACLQHRLAQIVASDAHNMTHRKPNLGLCDRLPEEVRQMQELVTEAVWDNEMPPYFRPTMIKKTIFGYR